ncbi:MAG TPA: hypothetical protein VI233_14880, partial [Puia sp.]
MQNKFLLRLFIGYFLILVLPLNAEYWRRFFTEGWWRLSYSGIFNIAHYVPGFSAQPAILPDWP